MRDESGTALIESLLALTIVAAVLGGGLLLMYLSLVRSWVSHTAYEATMCLATDADLGHCEREVKAALRALPVGRFDIRRLERAASQARVAIDYRVGDVAVIRRSERLPLPLVSSGGSHAR